MSDLISRHKIIKAIDKFIPADPMKSDYTQGISVGIALATRCIEEFSQETDESSQGLVKDLISRQDAIEAVRTEIMSITDYPLTMAYEIAEEAVEELPSAEPERKKGHWVEMGDEPYDEWECDMCGFVIDGSGCIDPEEYKDVYKFCPNCGADMRGEQDETE